MNLTKSYFIELKCQGKRNIICTWKNCKAADANVRVAIDKSTYAAIYFIIFFKQMQLAKIKCPSINFPCAGTLEMPLRAWTLYQALRRLSVMMAAECTGTNQ